jgi:hypothetical protein
MQIHLSNNEEGQIYKKGSLPILRKFWLYSKPQLIYAGRLDSLHYNFPEKW